MGGNRSLRHLAIAAAASIIGCERVLALPQVNEVVQPAPPPWVTVNENGVGVTMTPHVISLAGATTTQNPPPAYLTSTATYTLSPSNRPSTYTGLPPAATATGKSAAGAFLACTAYQSAIWPFCSPMDGSPVYPGLTYYIAWNPSYFTGDPSQTLVEVQATSADGAGFTSGTRIPASMGFYAWTIDADILTKANRKSLNLTFSLVYADESTSVDNDLVPITGPTVLVLSGSPPSSNPASNSGGGPSAVVIAVPIVVALVVLGLAGFCFWSWKRHGTVPVVGALGKVGRRSSGYGVRQSRSERVGGAWSGAGVGGGDKPGPNVGIQLTDRDSWSPTGTGASKNVFREELQRQERQR